MTLLDACGVVAGYGETEILHGVSITVGMGEVVTIIGPNGCGKSTLMKAIVGLIRMRSGSIMFRGEDISGMNCLHPRITTEVGWAALRRVSNTISI